MTRPDVTRAAVSGLWVAGPVVTSLVVAGPGVSGLVVVRAGLAKSVVSSLVLIFLAVASLVAITSLASRPARATTWGGHVQARCGSSRMRCLPIAAPAYGGNSTNTDLAGKAVIGMKACR
jgi:hypothetical protein